MKSYFKIFGAIFLVVSLLIFFSGCNIAKQAAETIYDELQKAELTAKAITGSGWESSSSKAITTGVAALDDFSGSNYYSDINNSYTLFSIQFSDHPVTVEDDNGNNVTVTLNGTVYFAYFMNVDYINQQLTFKLYAYGSNITSTVDGEGPVPYTVDIYFSLTISSSETGTTASGNIQGSVGETQVSTTFSVNVPQYNL